MTNRANSSFSTTYKEDNTSRYIRTVSIDRTGPRNLWAEIARDRNDREHYKLIAYTNDRSCGYTMQFQNNIMLPVYWYNALGLKLEEFGYVKDMTEPVILFVESYTINDTMQMKELIEYYRNVELSVSDTIEENVIAMQDIVSALAKESFPAVVRLAHVVRLNNYKHERRIYVPSLNMVIYKSGKDLRYAGEHPRSREASNRLNVSPKNSLGDRNLYQHYFKIINNEEPGRKYYFRMFNRVVEIESTPSMKAVENSCVKMAYYQEQRLIEEVIKEGLSDENLKALGIYKSRIEAENAHDINKLIEAKKIDLELNKINLNSNDMIFKAGMLKNSLDTSNRKLNLERKRLDLEFERLDLDKGKLLLDNEKLELEFNKLYKESKLVERSYRNEIGKLNIGLIKEATEVVSVVIKLANLIKSFFSKE